MSRVDEAMRRAAAGNQAAPPIPQPESARPAPDPAHGFLEESFPVEGPEAREEAVTLTPVAAPDALSSAPAGPSVPAPGDSGAEALLHRIDARLAEKIVIDEHILPASREQYRRLAAVLHDAQVESGIKVIMIASAVVGEGKTLTASNLALTLSESYRRRVLLIDGDLRRPSLHHVFRIDAASGLSEGLTGREHSKLLVRQVSATLGVLPAGRPNHDPMEGLTSERMHRLVAEARDAFDWVIIDTPPLILLPDAHLLAPISDAVVLVIRADSTPHALVKRAVEAIGNNRIAGVVLNAAKATPGDAYGGYYGYYGYSGERAMETTTGR